jgi:hypothetical protein
MFASVELLLLALHSGGYLDVLRMALINTAMYDVAIVAWLGYAIAPHAVRNGATNHLQTQRWEQSLADLHGAEARRRVAPDSLIPMFEGMVERAFSRSSHLDELDEQAAAAKAGGKNS